MPNRLRTRVRRWVYARIPEWIRRRDFEVFTAALCLTASIPILFFNQEPGQATVILPGAVEYGWSITLFLGPLLVISGIYMNTRHWSRPERGIVWARIEALGLTMLAYVGYIYWGCIAYVVGISNALFASTVVLAFAFICHVREIQIQLDIVSYKSAMGVEDVERR